MSGPHRGAGELLGHYIPGNVLLQARDLAMRFRRDEIARAYAEKHIWLVVSVGLSCMLLSALVSWGVAISLRSFIEPSLATWLPVAIMVLAIALWLLGTMFLLYRFFDWLEKKALREAKPAGDGK